MSNIHPSAGQTRALMCPILLVADVQKQQPKPCITILVHGVNDLAGVYADLEEGLCEGLNERLDHLKNAKGQVNAAALNPATYTSPPADNADTSNPDAIYYRRRASQGKKQGSARSVVIPFYWGYREDDGVDPATGKKYLQKNTPHGEWLDRYGNRLDKAGTKEGGAFVNATTSLPDMWGRGFSGRMAGVIPLNPLFGSPAHPLLKAPGRQYMLLAAQRLAMLVRIIRSYRSSDGCDTGLHDTINVVAHSQGSLITLLANALLKEQGERPIDGFVMMSSPYSLLETTFEHGELFDYQQTTEARLKTLAGIVQYIGATPTTTPALTALADHTQPGCIGGLRWTGAACKTTLDGREVGFNERDNRGRVFLYFTPHDQTVGMQNVQGIGWQGVGDTVSYQFDDPRQPVTPAVFAKRYINPVLSDGYFAKTLPALSALGERFSQRVFTLRTREGQHEEVGKAPTYTYVLKAASHLGWGETTWQGTELSLGRRYVANAPLKDGQAVTIAAPALPAPFVPDFGTHGTRIDSSDSAGIAPVRAAADPIDAAIAVTNHGMKALKAVQFYVPPDQQINGVQRYIEEHLPANHGKSSPWNDPSHNDWAAAWRRVSAPQSVGRFKDGFDTGMFVATEYESPNEAKQRMMSAPLAEQDAISFHSAIPANPMHSRKATAYDVAIGQAKSIDDEAFYAYLCRVADWRLDWEKKYSGGRIQAKGDSNPAGDDEPSLEVLALYKAEQPINKSLIDDTVDYRQTGKRPTQMNINMPKLVVSQTVGGRQRGVPLQEGGTPPQGGVS